MVKELKCFIYNLCKDVVLYYLFKKFNNRKYKNVRYIIDCIEMFIEILKDFKIKVVIWLDYKYYYIFKVFVFIMLCGFFNFVLEVWGGWVLDVVII